MSRVTVSNLVGCSPAFREAVDLVRHIAETDAPVLIEGETGTGKEVAARAIHYSGARQEHPFVAVNCGALPEHLIENELFGHIRGAYTDARGAQPGLVALADGGTLFLDEVESLSARAQVALLRFLQDLRYRPLGGHREERANVRVIAATNVGLYQMMQAKQFRSDLYYRLQILFLRLPPLRERPGDPAILASHFVAVFSARYGWPRRWIAPGSMALLDRYDWPGNVRELENLVHRALLLTTSPEVTVPQQWLAAGTAAVEPSHASDDYFDLSLMEAKARVLDQFERVYVSRALAETRGNVSEAARRAGKERRAFGKLLKKYSIDKRMFLAGS
ncbi:MAG TPA: sigma-54 dependent transcriptional regulator [Vicinamibacterales bacterium]|nr:sigma-54 dependent transcriptional regulator [Vicinamibacterales bacterium]